jgi:pimeloyl-ACP methyl ester carboxylesterase
MQPVRQPTSLVPVLVLVFAATPAVVRADTVALKNGSVYRGVVDRDNTIVSIFDGLKRVVIRDSKVAKIEADASFRNLEEFRIEQPLLVHGGAMPKEIVSVKAEPWSKKGRRPFQYVSGRSGKPVIMEQAINEMGPHVVRIRGVDGFWQGQLATDQVPRDVIMAILAKVDQTNENERLRVARFLIQAGWYQEAKAELDRLKVDFPAIRERVDGARTSVLQLEAVQLREEIDVRRRAQQFREVDVRLRSFPVEEVDPGLLVSVRDLLRAEENQAASDKELAASLLRLNDRLSMTAQDAWRKPVLEVVRALGQAPDAVRDRLSAWQKASAEATASDEAQFALALSGYVAGADAAVPEPELAALYWKARDLTRDYLSGHDPGARGLAAEQLQALPLPGETSDSAPLRLLDLITRMAVRMPPPLHEDDAKTTPGEPRLHRVQDDENLAPTEYEVLLPPEYHPLRAYPTVVALHSGDGPRRAIDWWAAEAGRRGYIVIAPEYNLPGKAADYRYTASEHAAVELALRDAKRRYSIDDDRVFLGGSLTGGHMAWDYGLAHPDLFAGVAIVSGLPLKYAYRMMGHTELLPLYVALGDLAPASNELVFGELLKPLIAKSNDITYVEYYRRGLEDFPEEAAPILDWMDKRRRKPFPTKFEVATARESDGRFYGVVIREFQPGRTTAPEAVDPFGKNLKPATIKMTSSTLSNLLSFQVAGVKRMDIWVSPTLIDFKKKLEVRVNGKSFKQLARPGPESLLEDLRIRGDRRQVYWLKVPAG